MPISFYNENLTLAQMRSLVSQLSELEIGSDPNDDITTDLVNSFIKEGFQKIVALSTRFPYYQSEYGFSTIADIRNYGTFTQTLPAGGGSKTLSDVNQIISVVNNTNSGNALIYIDKFKLESIFVGTQDIPGIPVYFTFWANTLQLYPEPDQVYSITLRGYRRPDLDWLQDENLDIDISPEFQLPLANYVMARIFQYQEDPEMANVYMRNYESEVAIIQANLTAPNSNQPIIMSGGLQINEGYWYNSNAPYLQVMPGSPNPIGLLF